MRILIINGQEFNTLDGFYKVLEPCLEFGDCPWGQNLDALDEVVMCNFNYTGDEEKDVTRIIWSDFQKSADEIREKIRDKTVIEIIEDIFQSNKTIEFIKK